MAYTYIELNKRNKTMTKLIIVTLVLILSVSGLKVIKSDIDNNLAVVDQERAELLDKVLR